MKTVLVSGCFDIIHGGHVQFLRDARALGDRLVVCVAGDESLIQHKGRLAAMPVGHKAAVLHALICVDEVQIAEVGELGLDFAEVFDRLKPDILAVAGDDTYGAEKCDLVRGTDCQYVVLRKDLPYEPISTTDIRRRVAAPAWVPLRVDFAGGWLDVPAFARDGGRIVNLAIIPGLALRDNWLPAGAGLGGSAAWAALNGEDGIATELRAGVGWQDPAVIEETGLCVWESGPRPRLEMRESGEWLRGLMAIRWTGQTHCTTDIVATRRDMDGIAYAGMVAAEAVRGRSLSQLRHAINYSYQIQVAEGMERLPVAMDDEDTAAKYCGSGHGGYALYVFSNTDDRAAFVSGDKAAKAIEPYDRWSGPC